MNTKDLEERTPLHQAAQGGKLSKKPLISNINSLSIFNLITIQVMWMSLDFSLKMAP